MEILWLILKRYNILNDSRFDTVITRSHFGHKSHTPFKKNRTLIKGRVCVSSYNFKLKDAQGTKFILKEQAP